MLALGGRLPTADEFDTVDRLGATGVELVLMNMMKEERFLERLKELFNDVLLTDRFLGGNNMLERLDRERYPAYWFESTPLDEDLTEDQERNIRRRLRDRANDGTARRLRADGVRRRRGSPLLRGAHGGLYDGEPLLGALVRRHR